MNFLFHHRVSAFQAQKFYAETSGLGRVELSKCQTNGGIEREREEKKKRVKPQLVFLLTKYPDHGLLFFFSFFSFGYHPTALKRNAREGCLYPRL